MGCARHHFVSIICLISFNPQKNPMKQMFLMPGFREEDINMDRLGTFHQVTEFLYTGAST